MAAASGRCESKGLRAGAQASRHLPRAHLQGKGQASDNAARPPNRQTAASAAWSVLRFAAPNAEAKSVAAKVRQAKRPAATAFAPRACLKPRTGTADRFAR